MGPPVMGAQRPTAADRTFDHESRKERSRDDDKRERKRAREEEKEGRSSGREGRLEKRKEVNASNRAMRDRSPGGLEADEGTLLGGPTNEFQAQCVPWSLLCVSGLGRRLTSYSPRRPPSGSPPGIATPRGTRSVASRRPRRASRLSARRRVPWPSATTVRPLPACCERVFSEDEGRRLTRSPTVRDSPQPRWTCSSRWPPRSTGEGGTDGLFTLHCVSCSLMTPACTRSTCGRWACESRARCALASVSIAPCLRGNLFLPAFPAAQEVFRTSSL